MKTLSLSLALLALTAAPLTAQTASTAHPSTTHTSAAHTAPARPSALTCAKLPTVSSKIPALPAGSTCPKSLLSFTTRPSVELTYTSPLVSKEVVDSLGLSPTSFTLAYVDTEIGTGPLALPRKFYTMKYTGYLEETGAKFDSSADHPKAFTFPVGAHKVIAGWDLGLQGMHIGGKRRLFIPWQLAYGDRGNPQGGIPPHADLVFDVEIVAQSDEDPNAPPPAPTPGATPAPGATPPAGAATPKPATAPATTPAAPATTPAKPATPPPATTPKQ